MNGFELCFHLLDEKTIVVYAERKDELHLYDIVASRIPTMTELLTRLPMTDMHRVVFHFTPDRLEVECPPVPCGMNELFVRKPDVFPTEPFLFPELGQA
jgi:hypothetical protein